MSGFPDVGNTSVRLWWGAKLHPSTKWGPDNPYFATELRLYEELVLHIPGEKIVEVCTGFFGRHKYEDCSVDLSHHSDLGHSCVVSIQFEEDTLELVSPNRSVVFDGICHECSEFRAGEPETMFTPLGECLGVLCEEWDEVVMVEPYTSRIKSALMPGQRAAVRCRGVEYLVFEGDSTVTISRRS